MTKKITVTGEVVFMEEMCAERGCACYDSRVDKAVRMYPEEMVATLEQENLQLRARIERLKREQSAANVSQIDRLWQLANGNPLPFARMLESYHGIGEPADCGGAQHAAS